MRTEALCDKTIASPYPRLRRLHESRGKADRIVEGDSYRFRHPHTGQEVHLADVP